MNWFKVLLLLELGLSIFIVYLMLNRENCIVSEHIVEHVDTQFKGIINMECDNDCMTFDLYRYRDGLDDIQSYMTDIYPIGNIPPSEKFLKSTSVILSILFAATIIIGDL